MHKFTAALCEMLMGKAACCICRINSAFCESNLDVTVTLSLPIGRTPWPKVIGMTFQPIAHHPSVTSLLIDKYCTERYTAATSADVIHPEELH